MLIAIACVFELLASFKIVLDDLIWFATHVSSSAGRLEQHRQPGGCSSTQQRRRERRVGKKRGRMSRRTHRQRFSSPHDESGIGSWP